MFAKLSALVGGGPALNYTVEQAHPVAWGCWSHHAGVSREDNATKVSVFRIAATDANDPKLIAARNGVKRLKLLRHPNVLAFKDSLEVQEKGSTVLYLVTEAVQPLQQVLDELALSGQHRDEFLAMGMFGIASAVSFINNDCKMIHGNLCMDAVVVTESLDWKLHGFDLLSEHALPGDFGLRAASWMVPPQYKAAEVARQEWDVVRQSPPWAVDAWGLGCMLQEVFSTQRLDAVEQLRRTDVIPAALLQDYQRLLSSNPARRQNTSAVAASAFLKNQLVDVVSFMESIAVKDSAEKDAFFKKLPGQLPSIPGPVASRKILPLITKALEFGGAPASALSSVLLIGKPLQQDEFLAKVVPCLSRLFASPDRNLRRNLLESIEQYGPLLTPGVVEEQIFPHLSTGFTDENAYIRELTLKSMMVLAPKLKQATLTQQVLKHLSKLQIDTEPSIRTNTTVLLGNLAPHLGDATCKKVYLNAFGRALKDAFPFARAAALHALVATQQYYTPEEMAARALPAVTPLSVDPLPEVRSAALACMSSFQEALARHHEQLKQQAETAGAAAASATSSTAPSAAGVMGWAMSGLSASAGLLGGMAGGTGAAAATAGTAAVSAPAARASPQRAAPSAAAASASAAAAGGYNAGSRPAQAAGAAVSSSTPPAAANGWDDDDEELLGLEDDAEQQARQRLAGLSTRPPPPAGPPAAPRAPAAAAAAGGTAAAAAARKPAAAADGWAAGNDDDDGWDDMDTPATATSSGASSPAVRTTAAARRPAGGSSRRPAGSSGGGGAAGAAAGGAGARPKGAMRLGATKLGAQKLDSSDMW